MAASSPAMTTCELMLRWLADNLEGIAQPQMTAKFRSVFGPKSRSSPWCISARCRARRSMMRERASTAWSRARARISWRCRRPASTPSCSATRTTGPTSSTVDTASTATMAYVIGAAALRNHSAVRRQRAVGPDELDGARGRDRRVVRARDLHRHLRLRHGAVDAGRRQGAALSRPARAVAISPCSTTSPPSSPIRSTGGALPTGRGARCSRRSPTRSSSPARSPARRRRCPTSRR